MSVEQMAVSSDYFTVLGLDLVSGRGFTPAERTAEAGVVVVSQSIARQLWPGGGGGVGQVLRLEASSTDARSARVEPSRSLAVIGIVRDRGRTSGTSNLVYLPAAPESPGQDLMLRVRGNPEQARMALLERLTGLDPAFGILTLRTTSGMQTYLLQIAFGLTVVLGGLALVLTVSGLFSVLSYLVEQQAKEIGVRMALGAATKHVAELVLSQSLRPVGIGLVAGGGAGHGGGDRADGDSRRRGDRCHGRYLRSRGLRRERARHRHCIADRCPFPPCAPPASIRSRSSERTDHLLLRPLHALLVVSSQIFAHGRPYMSGTLNGITVPATTGFARPSTGKIVWTHSMNV